MLKRHAREGEEEGKDMKPKGYTREWMAFQICELAGFIKYVKWCGKKSEK